jgi:hypothetical protein
VICDECGERQQRQAVRNRLARERDFIICAECGNRISLQPPDELTRLPAETRDQVQAQQAHTKRKTVYEEVLVYIKRLVEERDKPAPDCFISYAWGDEAHEDWVEQLAADLKNAGIDVILDRWADMAIGQSVNRFVGRLYDSQYVLVVGTPAYLHKHENVRPDDPHRGYVVSAEADLFEQRLVLGSEEVKATVLPVLAEGEAETALPPLLRGRVYADFRDEQTYFVALLETVLTLYGLANEEAVRPLRVKMREAAKEGKAAEQGGSR